MIFLLLVRKGATLDKGGDGRDIAKEEGGEREEFYRPWSSFISSV